MKMMNRILIPLCVLFISCELKAHQPGLSSTLLVEQEDNKWVLQVRSALTAYEYQMEKYFGESAYGSPEEFQELVTDYLKKNIVIQSNGDNSAVLRNGVVKLGHETTATFEVIGMPKAIRSLVIGNSSFSDITRNQSALIVVKKGFSKEQFVLNDSNGHMVKLEVKNAKLGLVNPTQEVSENTILVFFTVIGFVLALYFAYKNKRIQRFLPIPMDT